MALPLGVVVFWGSLDINTNHLHVCKTSVCPRVGNLVLGMEADPDEDMPGTSHTAETQHHHSHYQHILGLVGRLRDLHTELACLDSVSG